MHPRAGAHARRLAIPAAGRLARVTMSHRGKKKTVRIVKKLVRDAVPHAAQGPAAGIVKGPAGDMDMPGRSLADLHDGGLFVPEHHRMRLKAETLLAQPAPQDVFPHGLKRQGCLHSHLPKRA